MEKSLIAMKYDLYNPIKSDYMTELQISTYQSKNENNAKIFSDCVGRAPGLKPHFAPAVPPAYNQLSIEEP